MSAVLELRELELRRQLQWHDDRKQARTDLFFLLTEIMVRNDINRTWLMERCQEVQAGPNGFMDLWAREHYKDLADDTAVLTHNRGWTTHGELAVGDQVYAPDGSPQSVIALSARYEDSECYRLTFSDGASLIAGAGHLWRVRRKHKLRVGDWRANQRLVSWDDEIVPTCELGHRADIGVLQAPIAGSAAQLPVDPYVLGAWLGDGTTGGSRITAAYSDADEMQALLISRGVEVSRATHSKAVSLRIGTGKRGNRSSSDFTNGLRDIGVFRDKHIPHAYLNASIHQRMILLRGLMDTDGHNDKGGTAQFVNANKRLAEGVYELAVGLALRPRFREFQHRTGPYKGNTFYQVCFQAHTDRCPFAMQRKAIRCIKPSAHRNCRDVVSVERIESVPTRCIQVEGGMYLAGRELIPTHNSTIITFAKTIQDILSSHGKDPLPEWNGREVTFGIFSHTRPIAKAFLRQIKLELETNERLHKLFPDILWDDPRKAPKWSEDEGITVKRRSNPKEATVEAWGLVDGQPTSKHFLILVYDDVVTRESVTTPEMIAKTTSAVELSFNLGSEGGHKRFIGSRYHYNDTYKALMERGTATPRIYPATDDGSMTGRPVLLTEQSLQDKRRDMGPYTFGAQMLLDPRADETQGFREEWLRFYDKDASSGTNRYILVDPASGKRPSNDYTSMWVVGLGADKNYYVLDMIRDRLNLTQRASTLMMLHRKWEPLQVRYEKVGMQADVEHIRTVQDAENYRFTITEVGASGSKPDRIKRLVPLFEQGRVYLPRHCFKTNYEGRTEDIVDVFTQQEYKPFPVMLHDDMLDALARIAEPELHLSWPQPSTAVLKFKSPWGSR